MRSLIDSTRSLFARLYQSWGKEDRSEESPTLDVIAELDDPGAIPTLVGVLYRQSGHASEVAATTIQRIVDRCSPLDLAQLDQQVRQVAEWWGTPLLPKNVSLIARNLVGTLGVLSFHANGRFREAAVDSLSKSANPQALPFLLIRLNDWVLPVREAAKAAVFARLQLAHVAAFVGCLPLIFRLKSQTRAGHAPVVESILDLLRCPEAEEELRTAMRSADRQTRRLAFKLLAERALNPLISVLIEGTRSEDTTIRLMAARHLRERLSGEELRHALERLLDDRFMPVRREALYGFVEKLPELAPAYLREALFDSHAPIREVARFHLRQGGGTDPAEFYRSKLKDREDTAVAVAGLGETGTAPDARLLEGYLRHPEPRVRRAAVRAIARLDDQGHDEEMLIALADDSPRVAKAAREVILLRPHLLSAERLWSLFTTASKPHVRQIALPLMARLPWWDSAVLLLAAASSGDKAAQVRAIEYLKRWQRDCARLTRLPTIAQMSRLRAAMDAAPAGLDASVRDDIELHLTLAEKHLA